MVSGLPWLLPFGLYFFIILGNCLLVGRKVKLENLTIAELVNKFLFIYGTPTFIVFTIRVWLMTNNNTVRLPSKNRRNLWTTEIPQTLLIAHAHAGLREHQIVTYYLVKPMSLLRGKATENTGCKVFGLSVLNFNIFPLFMFIDKGSKTCPFYILSRSVFSTV